MANFIRPHTRDEGQAPFFALRIQTVNQTAHIINRCRRSKFDADRITHMRKQFNMRIVNPTSTFTNPQEVTGGVVRISGA